MSVFVGNKYIKCVSYSVVKMYRLSPEINKVGSSDASDLGL